MKSMIYAQPMLRMVARRADHIFTVSEYSKRQIMDHLGVEAERITVVYNGIGPHIFPEAREAAAGQHESGLWIRRSLYFICWEFEAQQECSTACCGRSQR